MDNLSRDRVTPTRPFLSIGLDYAVDPSLSGPARDADIALTRNISLSLSVSGQRPFIWKLFRTIYPRPSLPPYAASSPTETCAPTSTVTAARRSSNHTLHNLFTASTSDYSIACRYRNLAATAQGIRWHFNPLAAPHFSGLWEAAVKSIKFYFRQVIDETTRTFEELSTLLAQMKGYLNSRLLQALFDDPDDILALTPGYFLIGAPLFAVLEPSLTGQPKNTLSQWRHLQFIRNHFWQQWSMEYIHGLTPRSKWLKYKATPHIGDLCLVLSEFTPPNRWPLARITNLHPEDDGIVRVVSIRAATSELVPHSSSSFYSRA